MISGCMAVEFSSRVQSAFRCLFLVIWKHTCYLTNIFPYRNMFVMARLKTTHDIFSAIGEPKRRILIEQLVLKEMAVNELVDIVKWPQPVVSKHLRVLKQVRIVSERKDGRRRLYKVQPEEFRPIQEWMHQFEKYWGGSLDQLDSYLVEIQERGKK